MSNFRSEAIYRIIERDLLEHTHAKGAAVLQDTSDRIAQIAGRRSGKSDTDARLLVRAAARWPMHTAVYAALSKPRAVEMMSTAFERIESQSHLDLRMFNFENNTYWTFPGGGRIWVTGCADRSECEKFRGDPRSIAIVDEADSMRAYLEYLLLDCIEPSLMDLQAPLVVSGTPGATLNGYFYKATTRQAVGWSVHDNWTALDNPFLPHASEWIERKRKEMPRARFMREIMGVWERDPEALMFCLRPALNYLDTSRLPLDEGEWTTILSIDIGFTKPVAWTVWRYRRGTPNLNICYSKKQSGLTPSQSGAATKNLIAQWRPSRVIVDTGGIGKGYVTEWADRYHINSEPAQKRGKGQRLATFAGEISSGAIKIDPSTCQDLIDEMEIATWNENHDDIEESLPHDCIDSALYGFNETSSAVLTDDSDEDTNEAEARRLKELARLRVEKRITNPQRYQ